MNTNVAVRVAGSWLAVASALLIVVLIAHGPVAPDLHEQMTTIADAPLRWSVVHWMAAGALSLFTIAGLVMVACGSRFTATWATMTAWAVLAIGALWTATTAVAEATVVADAAASGDTQTFDAWWAFSEGKATGFAALGLAVAVIAVSETRAGAGSTPTWASWIGAAAAVASVVGWVAGMWLGLVFGGPLWVAGTVLMCAWTFWFGLALAPGGTDAG